MSFRWVCYCVSSESINKTYVGSTNNLKRRIKQHNGILKNGAKATRVGRPWKIFIAVTGFQSKSECLSFEWHWKKLSKVQNGSSELRRRKALLILVLNNKWKNVVINEMY